MVELVSIASKVRLKLRKANLSYIEKTFLNEHVHWTVDFYIQDYGYAIICCENYSEFWKKMFICQDIMRNSNIACCLVVGFEDLGLEELNTATRYDLPILTLKKLGLLIKIIRGELEADEVNYKVIVPKVKASRIVTKNCRRRILNILSKIPLTKEDLTESLRREFPLRTINWCLNDLRRKGKIIVLGYVAGSKKAIYGVSTNQIEQAIKHYNLSKSWKRQVNSNIILKVLRRTPEGITIRELSNITGLKITQIIALLRFLENRSKIKRIYRDGKTYWLPIT